MKPSGILHDHMIRSGELRLVSDDGTGEALRLCQQDSKNRSILETYARVSIESKAPPTHALRKKVRKMYKLTAPDVDVLLRHFDRGFQNSEKPSRELMAAMEPLLSVLSDLAPCKENDEAKIIWITIPRGVLSDYGSFEEAKE